MRRRATTVLLIACALLALPAMALADGRAVLDDYEDNGQIDGCYPLDDFTDALELIGEDDAQYGAATDVVRQARVTNVEVPGEDCATTTADVVDEIPAAPVDDGGSGGGLTWVIGLVALGVLALGAGLWARSRGGDRPS